MGKGRHLLSNCVCLSSEKWSMLIGINVLPWEQFFPLRVDPFPGLDPFLEVASGPRVKLASCKSALNPRWFIVLTVLRR